MDQRPIIGSMERANAALISAQSRRAVAAAWGGAAAFAASLAYFLYAYLVRFGVPAVDTGFWRPALTDTALFSAFALHHSLFARTPLKAWVGRVASPLLERSLYTWVASAMFAGVCWWWMPVPGQVYRLEGYWRWLGWGVQASGVLLAGVGSRALDVLDLAGVRPVLTASAASSLPWKKRAERQSFPHHPVGPLPQHGAAPPPLPHPSPTSSMHTLCDSASPRLTPGFGVLP
jgi:hypothetical protein